MTVIEANELEGVLLDFADALANDPFEVALQECKVPIATSFIGIFARQQASDGSTWPEHAPFTVAQHGPHPLLILTGAMFASMTNESAQGHVGTSGSRMLSWGTGLHYAAKNNFGGPNDNGTYTPSREFVYWTEEAIVGCVDRIYDYLGDLVGKV